VINRTCDLDILQENYQITHNYRRMDNPAKNDHISRQHSSHGQQQEGNVQQVNSSEIRVLEVQETQPHSQESEGI
jgi:hypothetical protein